MKAVKVIKDPKTFQLLADDTRRKVIYLLRVKEMTVSQLASELNLTPQAVYHHIKKLLKGELVEVAREERVGHLIESYYRATAECYSLKEGKASAQTLRDKKLTKEQMTTVFNVLRKLDFHLDFDEDTFNQLINLQAQLEDCCTGIEKHEDVIYNMDELDWITRSQVESFVKNLSMSDEEFNRQHEIQRKFRNLLKSLVEKKKEVN